MRVTVSNVMICTALGLSVALNGCSDNDDDDDVASHSTSKFRNVEIAIVSESGLAKSNESVAGNGTFKFISPLSEESQGGAHVGLTFELLGDDSEVTLVTFAASDLAGGVSVKWTRSRTTVSADGKSKDITERMSGVDLSGSVSLRTDIHNNEDPTHVIMWNQPLSEEVDESKEIYNSEDSGGGDLEVPGRGDGVIGGVILKNANVTDILVTQAQEEDHE